MNKKQEVNCIFAVHFDDKDDPRYQRIASLMTNTDMWRGGNLIYASALDSRDDLVKELDKLKESEDAK